MFTGTSTNAVVMTHFDGYLLPELALCAGAEESR